MPLPALKCKLGLRPYTLMSSPCSKAIWVPVVLCPLLCVVGEQCSEVAVHLLLWSWTCACCMIRSTCFSLAYTFAYIQTGLQHSCGCLHFDSLNASIPRLYLLLSHHADPCSHSCRPCTITDSICIFCCTCNSSCSKPAPNPALRANQLWRGKRAVLTGTTACPEPLSCAADGDGCKRRLAAAD